ncbi:MAG TPA: hypothetical protein VMM78_19785 [Thermomicrobiales bacterium]|nr:hypothetical protein [Thermomicrobiales bacterium]
MKAITIKQRTIRLAGIAGLAIGLALSTGVAAAAPAQVGYTECDYTGCAVAGAAAMTKRVLTDFYPIEASLNGDPYRPHLTR